MSQYSPSKELQSKSKSIYSDVCQNESELNQIFKRRQRPKKRVKQRNKNNDNSFIRYNSKDYINEKNNEQINRDQKQFYTSFEYKSFHEEKTQNVDKENKDDNMNNNINDNLNNNMNNNLNNNLNNINDNINQNLNIDDNMKQFEISSINSNSNKQNFMEENTDTELNKFCGLANSDKTSQKGGKLKDLKNNPLFNYLKDEDSFNKYKPMNMTQDNKNNIDNKRLLNSLYYANKENDNNFLKNNLTTLQKSNKKKNGEKNLKKIENINQMIDKIKFEGLNKDELDIKYFDNKLTKIITKSKNIKKEKNKHIKTLYELQNFEADDSAITCMNINDEGNFLGIGFQSGKIKIYEIMNYLYQKYKLNYCIKNLNEYLNFINEIPYKTLSGHPNEIIDLKYLQSNNNNIFLLSASLDLVILWNLSRSNNFITRKYFHRQTISCISVNQVHKHIFGTGCTDNIIRLWPISRTLLGLPKIEKNEGENAPKQFYVQEDITSFSFFREGNKTAVGTTKGKVFVYTIFPKIKFEYKFECKNTFGKPIININFYSNTLCVISSLDSRIRLVNIKDGKIVQKYKGHLNEKNKIKTNIDSCNDIIVTGSENGICYLWNVYNKENSDIKNYNFEYFKIASSNDVINIAQIVSEKCYVNYYQKILSITNQIILDSIMIIGNDKGELKILINIHDSD